jgi:hypothetical protein
MARGKTSKQDFLFGEALDEGMAARSLSSIESTIFRQ